MTRRKKNLSPAVAIPAVLVIAALGFFVRFGIAGGDMGCFWAQDPALCVAVKGVGR